MAEKNNATCSICGSPYYVCMSCRDSLKVSPWKVHCDTAPHYQVYQVIHGYNTKVYTKDEAKRKLQNINLEDMNTFRPHIKQIIEDILKEEKPIEMTVEKAEPVTEVKEAVDNAVVANVEDIVRPTISRKRNYKVDVE